MRSSVRTRQARARWSACSQAVSLPMQGASASMVRSSPRQPTRPRGCRGRDRLPGSNARPVDDGAGEHRPGIRRLGQPYHSQARLQVSAEFDLPVELDVRVGELELPQQQRIELMRALCQEPTVLLLDEPTSLLPPTLIDVFLEKVRDLADRGLAVLLITHRLDEARSIADRVTILRGGRVIGEYDHKNLPSANDLAHAMVGTTVVERSELSLASQETLLEAYELWVVDEANRRVVNGVTLRVAKGEILGVDGNGQLELLESIAGLRPTSSGCLLLWAGTSPRSPSASAGTPGFTSSRATVGATASFRRSRRRITSSMPSVPTSSTRFRRYSEPTGCSRPTPATGRISCQGGNQQKLIVAQACERDSRVLLLSYPTQGLDVRATVNIRDILVAHASHGTAIVFTSSDLDELLSVSHCVVVMNRGRVVGEQRRAEYDRKQLAEWYAKAA